MKLSFNILLFICAFTYRVDAQVYFNKIYPYGTMVANATSVIEIDTGGYLFPNCTFGSYNSLLISRINSNGDTLFTKEYVKPFYSYSTGTSNSIIHTYDNNYVFSGSIKDTLNNRNALIIKINSNGDTIWTRSYGGANFDNSNIVCQTPDSGFVLMGVTQSYSAGPASDFYLIKTDKNGTFQWQKVYGTTLAEDCVSGQITLDGGFILSGHRNNQLHIVKTDNNGNFKWEKVYSGTAGQGFVKQLLDSTYILVGAKAIAGLGYQAYIAKLTKSGVVIWEKTYGGGGDEQFFAVPIILNDGSIICSGISTFGNVVGLLIKTDSSGNQQWLRTYYNNFTIDNYFYDVKHTLDNGYIMSGFTNHGWLVKVDSNGCEIANCNVGIDEFQSILPMFNVFPNPARNEINLLIEGENINDFEITIINVFGEKEKVYKGNSTINISYLESGVYFITAISKDGKCRLSEKFIKE
ncbi:MAG: T9SS type A sorting domain-containing protein [Bacteroidetes bacterium]|nr:T9SS type A sorting domain-containing protein [Bacteroidota bacterium]